MALFVLHKLNLQKRMRSHAVGLDVWFLVEPFAYFHTSCVRTAKALARLHGCTGSPEPSVVACMISTIISWAGSFVRAKWMLILLEVQWVITEGHIRMISSPWWIMKWGAARKKCLLYSWGDGFTGHWFIQVLLECNGFRGACCGGV